MYAGRTPPEEAPCQECRVDLIEENTEAASVYMMCRGQVITAGQDNRPIDISTQAIDITMKLLGVVDQLGCLKRVRWLWFEVQKNES